jgi:hypothetical protein
VAPPQWSDNGQFWWNGQEWVAAPARPRPVATSDPHRMPGQTLPTPVIMILVAIVSVVLIFFVLFAITGV